MTSGASSAWRSTGTKPGPTELTVIPCGASSSAHAFISPVSADLAATYAERCNGTRSDTSESMCTMRPQPRSRMPASTARPAKTGLAPKNRSWSRGSPQPGSASRVVVEGVAPAGVGERDVGLRAGGVEHQHIDRPETLGDRRDEFVHGNLTG